MAVLGLVNLRIQKKPRLGAMVVHVDKVKRYHGVTPCSWLPEGMGQDVASMLNNTSIDQLFQTEPGRC